MADIQHGKISELTGPTDANGNNTRARVVPSTSDGEVSDYMIIPWYLRGDMGKLQLEDDVVFTLFDDLGGIIIGRADGEWGATLYGDLTLKKGDIKTDSVASYNNHTHNYAEGTTDKPN